MTDQARPVLVTHSGKFHCDEVFAYAVLRLALGLRDPSRDHTLLRTRKPAAIEAGDIVFDVGGVHDEATDRFDHHQRGAPLRPDGTPFSSAGLVWRRFGEQAVRAVLPEADAGKAAAIAADLDESMVRTIDEIDNGVGQDGPRRRDSLGLASLIGDFNPSWDDPAATGETAGDAAFIEASALAEAVLRRKIAAMRARLAAEAEVLAAHAAGDDPRLLVLERGMPWKNVVLAHDLPVLLAVSPASNGNWMLDTVPPEPGSFAQKLPLPAEWGGLPEGELRALTGVPDAVFAHLRRFVAAARTRQGAIAMARLALRNA
ncbi:MYG1 family protein [Acetobacteraceae bacterium KSS8]|uniref:MYG1 family protein n=1 Tax=Endosaccharibacter trunci TaxID=2812733 RepID=A0ABT1W5G9_9PROT|nr:MYG1 family protein [Acetobacteraceae bacterium KSS8]